MNWLADAWNWVAGSTWTWWEKWFFDAAHNSSDWLRPLVDPGFWAVAVFSVWFIGSLVAARLVSLFVAPGKRWRLPDKALRVFTRSGLVLILLGSAAWTIIGTTGIWPLFGTTGIWPLFGTTVTGKPDGGHLLAFPAVISNVVGIIVLGRALGHRLRLQVEVTGRDGATHPVASAYVAARMEALGTSRPRGLSFPHGTDVGNLPESALSTSESPQSKIAQAIIAIARSVALIIPWKADVVIVDSETAAVTLTRNGRRLDSQLISTSSLLPDGAKREEADADRALLTAAATFILFRLSDTYPKLKEGLSGAERWRSVVAQVLATTIPWKNEPETTTELFARAVDEDPRNLAAWLGYLVQRSGSFGTATTLEWWLESLEKLLNALRCIDRDKKKEIALHIRLLRTLTFAYTNYRLLLLEESKQERVEEADRKALQECAEKAGRKALVFAYDLMNVVKDAPSKRQQPLLDEYVQRIKPLAASLYLHVVKLQPQQAPYLPDKKWWQKLVEYVQWLTWRKLLRSVKTLTWQKLLRSVKTVKWQKGSELSLKSKLVEFVQRIRPLAAFLGQVVKRRPPRLWARTVRAALARRPSFERTQRMKEHQEKEELNKLATKWLPEDTEMSSLQFHYDRACAELEEGNPDAKALPHLELALALKDLRVGATSDPSLKSVRRDPRFAALADRKVRIMSLNALKNHSENLAADGIRFASDFLWRTRVCC